MENINMDFNPNTALSDGQRLAEVESYLGRLSARIKFCLANITDELSAAGADLSENRLRRLEALIYSVRGEIGNISAALDMINGEVI